MNILDENNSSFFIKNYFFNLHLIILSYYEYVERYQQY